MARATFIEQSPLDYRRELTREERKMNRRKFIERSAVLASGAVVACAGHNALPLPAAVAEPADIDALAFHASRRMAETRFGNIAYVERGSGPAALFVHGFPLNGFQWRGALPRLSKYRRCIAPDLMGLGYSEVPERQSLVPESQADMLAALLDRLSVDAVDLVGNDSGGAVAQLFATRFPDRVRSLLLTNCDTQENCPPASLLPFIAMARAGKLADGLAQVRQNKALARTPEGMGGTGYTYAGHPTDEAIECYFAPIVSSPGRKAQFHQYLIALERNMLAGIEPALRRFAGPARMVWGDADTTFPFSEAEWLDRTFPKSRGIRRVVGGRLFFPEEMPDVIAQEARTLWGV
jgi:pimeloyl-ACP methyl ester carboxylesterase